MRHFYIIFLLSLPFSAEAMTRSAPDSVFVSRSSFLEKQGGEKRGFLKKFIEKRLLKRLAKAEKALGKSGEGDGKWLAISGLVAGPLGLLLAIVSPAFIFLILAGLILSILGLVKAKRQRASGLIRGLAITGVIVNSLIVVLIVLLAILIAQGWVTFLQF